MVVSKSHRILELLYRANAARAYKRLTILNEVSLELDLLKIFIRLAKDTDAMTDKHYIQLQGLLNEIGKMLGGWIKDQSGETKRPADGGNVREI